jgi:hypothetical protein
MGELVRTKVTLTVYPYGQMSLAYEAYSSFWLQGQKGELRKVLGEQFDLPPDSTEVLLHPIPESQVLNVEKLKGTNAQWTSLP